MISMLLVFLPFSDTAQPTPSVQVDDLIRVYLTNAAQADERFANRAVVVTGRVEKITRGGLLRVDSKSSKQTYHLWMTAKATGTVVCFRFTEDERPALAKLQVGQDVSVLGRPGSEIEHSALHVLECTLVPFEATVPPPEKK